MGTIYKRGNIFWIKYYRNGRDHYESSKSSKKTEAMKLLKKREGEIADGKLPGIYFDRVLFEELAEDYLTQCKINRQKSLDRSVLSVKHLSGMFARVRASAINTAKINAYIMDRIEQGAAHATINRELAALKAMLNLGARQTPPKINRVPHIPMLKETNTRKGFFEHGDFLALRENAPDYLKGIITFAYKVGWRRSEITSLKWSMVDRQQGIVRLEPGESKNDEGRTVYLDAELKEVFREQWNRRIKLKTALPWIFLNEHGTDRVKRFYKAWQSACNKAGIGGKLFHDFRRTAVRNMVRAGIPERVAMMISGHKTRSVFDRYNIVDDTDLRLAAQRQSEYLDSQTVTKTVTILNASSVDPHAPVAQADRAPDS